MESRPNWSAREVRKYESTKAMIGEISQIIQNCLTIFFEKVSFHPTFETLKASIAKVFS